MKIAWNEIKYQPKKFILIELLIIILMFMVVFLSGLTNGLGRSVSAQIDNYGGPALYPFDGFRRDYPFSTITAKDLNEVKDRGDGLFWLVHPTGNRLKTEDSNTLISPTSRPITTKKRSLIQLWRIPTSRSPDLKKNEVILDSSFKEDEGIQVGDQVIDKTSKQKLKVVAFAKMQNTAIARLALSARIPTQACGKNRSKLSMASPNPCDQEKHHF